MSANIRDILAKLQSGELSIDDASKTISSLEKPKGKLYAKVSEKGAISLYGLQRMPITLYVEQWETVAESGLDIVRQLIASNPPGLKRKSEMTAEELEADKKRRQADYAKTRENAAPTPPKPAAPTPPIAPPAQYWIDCPGGKCYVGPFASKPGANVFAQNLPDSFGPVNTISAIPESGPYVNDVFTPSAIVADLGIPA